MPNLELFNEKLAEILDPNLTAKELIERMVIAALECEYGKGFSLHEEKDGTGFTLNPSFAKMVNTLADSIITHPELRRQALSVASHYFKKNRDYKKNLTKTA
jgi:hypothetical protein